jgi:hypothetical protein
MYPEGFCYCRIFLKGELPHTAKRVTAHVDTVKQTDERCIFQGRAKHPVSILDNIGCSFFPTNNTRNKVKERR